MDIISQTDDFSWIMEPDAEYDFLDNRHDKGYKYLLSVKRVFVELIRSFVKQGWVNKIDENNVERIDKSFILKDFREKEADIVYKVKLDEREVFFYILLELQSTVDFQMPYRLLQYMMEIWRTVLHDTEKNTKKRKDFKLPVIVPCVLYNGKDNWTACRSFRDTLEFNDIFEDYILDFKYILFDIKRYNEDELLRLGNLIGSAFFIDQKSEYEEQLLRIRQLLLIINNLKLEEQRVFFIWVKNIILRGLPEEKAKELDRMIEQDKEDVNMVYALEEAIRNEFLKYEKKGEKRFEEGIEKGIEKGKIEVIIRASEKGFTFEDISDITGIGADEVKKVILEHKGSC